MSNTNTALEKRESTSSNLSEQLDHSSWYTPLVDIVENDQAFVFYADLPGVKAGDVDVSYESGVLTIQGKVHGRQAEGQAYVWREYGIGHFHRSFTIDTPVNVDGIRAELKHGVLELYVPKAEHAKTRKIQIKSA